MKLGCNRETSMTSGQRRHQNGPRHDGQFSPEHAIISDTTPYAIPSSNKPTRCLIPSQWPRLQPVEPCAPPSACQGSNYTPSEHIAQLPPSLIHIKTRRIESLSNHARLNIRNLAGTTMPPRPPRRLLAVTQHRPRRSAKRLPGKMAAICWKSAVRTRT